MICHYYISSLHIGLYQVMNAKQSSIETHEQNLSLKMSKNVKIFFSTAYLALDFLNHTEKEATLFICQCKSQLSLCLSPLQFISNLNQFWTISQTKCLLNNQLNFPQLFSSPKSELYSFVSADTCFNGLHGLKVTGFRLEM